MRSSPRISSRFDAAGLIAKWHFCVIEYVLFVSFGGSIITAGRAQRGRRRESQIQFGCDVLRDGAAEWLFLSAADLSAFVLERFGILTSFLQVKPKCARQDHRLPLAPPSPSMSHRLLDSGECLAM